MTSTTMYHPGLTFATLVMHFVMAQAVSLPSLAPRRGSANKGGGDPDDDDPPPPPPPTSTPPPSGSNPPSTTSHRASSSLGSSGSSTPHGVTTSPGSPVSASKSTSSSTSSSSPTIIPQISSGIRSSLSTPGIVGSVIGSVIVAGLLCMLLAKCIHRVRKARKRPKGFLPSTAFFVPTPRDQSPTREMSQTQSSPLISSAVAAGATSSPLFTRYSRSFSTSGTSSLSPLIPAASLHHSHSIGSSSNQSTTHTRATADLEILQTPPDSPFRGTSGGLLPVINSPASGSASMFRTAESASSPLHHLLTSHQKALEADPKAHDDVATMQIDKIEGVNDPPPGYNE